MKKTMLFAALAAVMVLVSCNKEDQELPQEKVTKTVTFNAVVPQTKASFSKPNGSNYPVRWSENDKKVDLLVNYNYNNKVQPDITRSDDNKSITFSADIETGGDAYTFVAVSPAGSVISANNTDKRFGILIPPGQTPTATSPDEKAIFLYAKSDDYDTFQNAVDLDFHHVTGYLHLVFTNYATELTGATVSSVTVTSEKVLAGRIFFFPGDGHMEENGTSGTGTVTVTTSSLDNVWVAVSPVDLSNETLTVVVNTNLGTITKRIQFGASAVLSSGKIAKFPISLSGSTIETPVQYNLVTDANQLHVGDKVIIVAANSDLALSTTQNQNNRGTAGITKGDGVILDPSDAVEVIELEDGYKPGEYALKATKQEGYLYAAYEESDGNHMKTKASLDQYGSWSISIADKQNGSADTDSDEYTKNVATIHATSSGRGLMLFNKTSSLFSAYGTGSSLLNSKVSYIHIYRLKENADDSPRFKATMPDADGDNNIATSSEAKDNIEVYVFGNVSWTAKVTGGATFTSSSSDSANGEGASVLAISVPENTSSVKKSYIVTVSTSALVATNSYQFSIEQDVQLPQVDDVLFFENWAGAADGSTNGALSKYLFGGTTVFGDANVVYTGDAYTKTDANKNCKEASGRDETLLIPSKGTWTITGIPCKGVATATLSYVINRSQTNKYVPTSTTDGVSIGAETQTKTVANGNTYYTLSFPVTFDSSKNLTTFDLTITNNHTDNTRFTLIKVVVNSTTGVPQE